jgi:hypothetical protein
LFFFVLLDTWYREIFLLIFSRTTGGEFTRVTDHTATTSNTNNNSNSLIHTYFYHSFRRVRGVSGAGCLKRERTVEKLIEQLIFWRVNRRTSNVMISSKQRRVNWFGTHAGTNGWASQERCFAVRLQKNSSKQNLSREV